MSFIISIDHKFAKSIGEIKYEIPDIQRLSVEDAVKDIYDFQKNYYDLHGKYCIMGVLSIVNIGDVSYLIDGQHRMKAYKMLIREFPERALLVNLDIFEGDLNQIYKLVNTQKPNDITTLSLDVYKVINDLEKYLNLHFKDYLKTTAKPQRPNFNFLQLKNYLLQNNVINKVGNVFIKRLEDLNRFYATISEDQFKLWGVKFVSVDTRASKCYLGLYSRFEWVDRIADNIPFEQLQHVSYDYRPKITKELKKAVWDCDMMISTCYVCTNAVHYEDFECGHIIPICRGGETNIKNLKRICRNCNNNMRSMDLEEYKKLLESQITQ